MKTLVVGTNQLAYPQLRNFAGLPFKNVEVRKVRDLFKAFDYVHFKILGRNHRWFQNLYFDAGLHSVDLFHFWNAINLTNKPWVVTFESFLPAFNPTSEFGMKHLVKDSCRKIIAITHRAVAIEKYYLALHPRYAEDILRKIIVHKPYQETQISSFDEKPLGDTFIF